MIAPATLETLLTALPKAELHLHLEGSIAPATVVELAARQGVRLRAEEVAARYQCSDFAGFLEAYKWVTSLLIGPAEYRLITERLIVELLAQNVVYAEVTLSVGVMLRRRQNVEGNFAAILGAGERALAQGLRLQWIFDAARQFGPAAAMEVARLAAGARSVGVVAFGMGGDELSMPAEEFRGVYDYARSEGMHTLAHAGEIGGPGEVRDAIELLGVERIGHGIAAVRDLELMAELAEKQIPLEVCPTSNLRTGALARQLATREARVEDHPLAEFSRRGLCLALSSDDPAMFATSLSREYALAAAMGLPARQLVRLAGMSFEAAFLPPAEKEALLDQFQAKAKSLALV